VRKAILPTLFLIFLIVLTLRAGNSNKDVRPFLGKWAGKYAVQELSGKTKGQTATEIGRNELKGYLQVYGTKRSFLLHLEGEQQGIDVKGTWSVKGDRLTLDAGDIVIDDRGGEQQRDPNRPYIPAEAVRATYGKAMTLQMSKDKKRLLGLTSGLGELIGRHEFVKDSP